MTQIEPLETFYEAEEYHHNFFQKNPSQVYCQLVVQPKIEKFRKHFTELISQK